MRKLLLILSLLLQPVLLEAVELSYRLQRPGRVSINIYDAQGRVVRELLHAVPRSAGSHVEHWDHCDGDGTAVAAGDYRWKLLSTPGLKAEYLLSVGTNYAVGPDDWRHRAPGCHGGPNAVAFDADGLFIAARITENIENCLIKQTRDGQRRLWSAEHPEAWKGGAAAAVVEGTLYLLATNGTVWPYDAATGKRRDALPTQWQGDKIRVRDGVLFPYDMDACAQHLVVSYRQHGALRFFDRSTGRQTREVAVADPAGVACAVDGSVYVISGSTILRLATPDAAAVTLVSDLVEPTRLCIDPRSGDLLVVEWGASQQVKRFAADGKPLRTYGRAGGRGDGLYTSDEQRSFRRVSDIAADGDGGFVVCEPDDAPRRVAHFDRNGRLLDEWYGGHSWAPFVAPEPGDPTAVWMNSSWDSLMRCTVDYRRKTWKVHSTYRYAGLADGLVSRWGNGQVMELREHDGELYICRLGDPNVLRVDRQRWRLLPAVAAAKHLGHRTQGRPARFGAGTPGRGSALWTDADGDGMPAEAEIAFSKENGYWPATPHVDDDLTYWFVNQVGDQRYAVNRYPVLGFTDGKAPRYGHYPTGEHVFPCPERVTKVEARWGSFLHHDRESGEVYCGFNERITDWGKSEDAFLVKWNREGELQWTVGRKGHGPGEIDVFRRCAGMAHGCIAFLNFSYEWATQGVTRSYVWDRDGLWVGELFEQVDLEAADESLYALGAEALSAQLHVDPRSGEVLLFGCWINEGRIYRISGWKGWERSSGELHIAQSDRITVPEPVRYAVPPGTGSGLLGDYFADDRLTQDQLRTTRVDPVIDFSWGKSDSGTNAPEPLRSEDAKASYSVRWRGEIQALVTGLHGFSSASPTWVGRIRVADQDVTPPKERPTRRIFLEAGKRYPIEIEYSTRYAHPSLVHGLRLLWQLPGSAWPHGVEPVPGTQLYPPAAP